LGLKHRSKFPFLNILVKKFFNYVSLLKQLREGKEKREILIKENKFSSS
jgi:hypothetical protein